MTAPGGDTTDVVDEQQGMGLDPDLVIANLADEVGRKARTVAMLQAALQAKNAECDELRAELVRVTGGGEPAAEEPARQPDRRSGTGSSGGRSRPGR